MKKVAVLSAIIALCIFLSNCKKDEVADGPVYTPVTEYNVGPMFPAGTTQIPASTQRSGDPVAGYDYLTMGDYISSGIPHGAYTTVFPADNTNELNRTGDNATIAYDFTAANAPNGVRVVGPNCMQCHASYLNGEFIMGLGNSGADFTDDQGGLLPAVNIFIQTLYGNPSDEWDAYDPFRKATEAISSGIVTESVGANPADKIAAILAAHRDPQTLEWIDVPAAPIPSEVVITDVPPWWLLKKKNAMFYAGMGRGDYARYLMASSLLTMENSTKADEVNTHFPDVLAYIYTLEAPVYPEAIDSDLSNQGQAIFESNCSGCHGTYGADEYYPNLLVDLDVVKTDPVLSDAYSAPEYSLFSDWFNNGWFGANPNGAKLQAEGGYVAQPLDGIWASAPYLHNGSVPTLEDLLNSSQRPNYWRRNFSTNEYDYEKVGWVYTTETAKVDKSTYDVSLTGYGNGGHLFGDALSTEDRTALIEYLKTL